MGDEVKLKSKPPLGLRPKYVAEVQRVEEILEAMIRYSSTKHPIPREWIDELRSLLEELL